MGNYFIVVICTNLKYIYIYIPSYTLCNFLRQNRSWEHVGEFGEFVQTHRIDLDQNKCARMLGSRRRLNMWHVKVCHSATHAEFKPFPPFPYLLPLHARRMPAMALSPHHPSQPRQSPRRTCLHKPHRGT